MDEEQPHVVVMPPGEDGGRTVRIGPQIVGRAFGMTDVVEFLRRAGWLDAEDWPPIDWRGGGPEVCRP
ncbi:hypothetical protein ACGF1Z_31280 [Streptomyces sp. NPDC048018]|uniref:hypothetical protein n=1 Tax=Streptomyces sp. NPDC048018 TaxID=3365499 RepID=UPI003722CCAC